MSKSLGNYIGVDEAPQEQYGKVLSLPDNLIASYFTLLTDIPQNEIQSMTGSMANGTINPMEHKKRLAREIVEQFWSTEDAQAAQEHFERTVQRREAPSEIPTLHYSANPESFTIITVDGEQRLASGSSSTDTLHALGLASSKSEAKRLVSQGAVEVDGVRVTDTLPIHDGAVVKVGKRKFVRLVEDKST
jgi:tyrosyl-tRNA synthetase